MLFSEPKLQHLHWSLAVKVRIACIYILSFKSVELFQFYGICLWHTVNASFLYLQLIEHLNSLENLCSCTGFSSVHNFNSTSVNLSKLSFYIQLAWIEPSPVEASLCALWTNNSGARGYNSTRGFSCFCGDRSPTSMCPLGNDFLSDFVAERRKPHVLCFIGFVMFFQCWLEKLSCLVQSQPTQKQVYGLSFELRLELRSSWLSFLRWSATADPKPLMRLWVRDGWDVGGSNTI